MAKRSTKPKKESLQNQYKYQVKRLNQAMQRIEKRGFVVDFEIPDRPKKLTRKYIEKLQNITTHDIYNESQFVLPSGEFVSGYLANTKKKKEQLLEDYEYSQEVEEGDSGYTYDPIYDVHYNTEQEEMEYYNISPDDLPNGADITISTYKYHIDSVITSSSSNLAQAVRSWVNNMIDMYGKVRTATMLERAMNEGHLLTFEIVYNATKVARYMTEMLNYMPALGPMERDQIESYIEDIAYFVDYENTDEY